MARSPGENKEPMSALVEQDKYSYGLRNTLNQDDLEKLNVDHSDWEIGDVFPLDILVKIIGKNSNEVEGGKANCSITWQITHIGAEEAEEEQPLAKHGYLHYD